MTDFIFFHIEKCGGTSLRFSLYNYFSKIYAKKHIYLPEHNKNKCYLPGIIEDVKKNNSFYDFDNLKVILSHIRYNSFPNLTNNCKFKFTSIRDPISRVISHYYFFNFPNNNIHMIDLNQKDFEKFVYGHGKHISHCLGIKKINEINKQLKEFTYIAVLENINNDMKNLNYLLNNIYNVNYTLDIFVKNASKKYKINIKDKNKLCSLIKKYCHLDYLVYNRVISLKNSKIIL